MAKRTSKKQATTTGRTRKPDAPSKKRPIEAYAHKDKKRVNNPPVGLVTPDTDPHVVAKMTYQYDPHLDPQLVWAGKAEHTSFEVPTVSLHVHERIDPRTIIEAVRKRNGNGGNGQMLLFEQPDLNPPLREAVEFYKHAHGWTNRLVAGDSLLVMNSLLEKEGLAGKVQLTYIDPPYGVRYKSNFQPFVNKREVKDCNDDDLTQEPETIRAFRDTWELGIHSYCTYLRDRFLLLRDLLAQSGGVFVQINAENSHLVRNVLDEVFGSTNYVADIYFRKKSIPLGARYLETMHDLIVLYAKEREHFKFRHLYEEADSSLVGSHGPYAMFPDGSTQRIRIEDFQSPTHPAGTRYYRLFSLLAPSYSATSVFDFEFEGKVFPPPSRGSWVVNKEKLEGLARIGRLQREGASLSYRLFFDDFPFRKRTSTWADTPVSYEKIYAVQTAPEVVARCLLMATDPGDLVFDPTCGSGTTAFVAEQWGRRWITCDTSRVALALAKQRLMTATFDYYELAHPEEGVGSGFKYKTVPHVTLKSIANNPEIRRDMTRARVEAAIAKYAEQETLYDQPLEDSKRARVTGPFTVEAVPAPVVRPISDCQVPIANLGGEDGTPTADASVSRSGETVRQDEWRGELLRCGIRGKAGQRIEFSRVETLGGTRWLHADAETKDDKPQRVVISFGPEHAPLEQRQVSAALEEASQLVPKPRIVVFASFEFDPEAAKDIDETKWPGVTLLKIKMDSDLLVADLKKKQRTNDLFWMIGQPDVAVRKVKDGEHKGQWQVEVCGWDYFNPRTGIIESGEANRIAMWLLDTDYDGRSLYPRQVFFPMAGEKDGWARLARNLRAEIDEELIEAYRGTVSLPFEAGKHGRAAVKIVDDRGIESLKIVGLT